MRERPILYSGPMVRAILEDRKTMTRRIMKPQPHAGVRSSPFVPSGIEDGHGREVRCPYGEPGDRLWVRESFWGCDLPGYGDQPCVVYDDEWRGKEYRAAEPRPWARKFGRIPSIHMPRDCSRITLEIVRVRVERLNDISEADAQAEGADALNFDNCGAAELALLDMPLMDVGTPYRNGFAFLWECINGAGSWAANPWVWAVEFRRVDQ